MLTETQAEKKAIPQHPQIGSAKKSVPPKYEDKNSTPKTTEAKNSVPKTTEVKNSILTKDERKENF